MTDPFHLGFIEPPRSCSYLPAETASLEYRVYPNLTSQTYGELLERGWRRHGRMIFRPQCPTCRQCRSLRVPVETFSPSKSQRRSGGRNDHITIRLEPATVTPDHIALYNAYHADMAQRRGWPGTPTTVEDYEASFLSGHYPLAWEMRYYDGDRLVGLSLIDILPAAVSSVYFYHDPAWRPAAPGVFSVLCEVELCRQRGIPHLYLGYWISGCPSMAYKSNYGPHELLDWPVDTGETPNWHIIAPK